MSGIVVTGLNKKTAVCQNLISLLANDIDIQGVWTIASNITDQVEDLIHLATQSASTPSVFPLLQVYSMSSKTSQSDKDFIGETQWDIDVTIRGANVFPDEADAYNWVRTASDLVETKTAGSTILESVDDLNDVETECEVVSYRVGNTTQYLAAFLTILRVKPIVENEPQELV